MATGDDPEVFGLKYDREKIMQELEDQGYCVIPDILTSRECDARVKEFRDWLGKFPDGDWPVQEESLIMRYRVGHLEPTWKVRLAAKKIFETVWQTSKLLASFDAVAISPPPETTTTSTTTSPAAFATPGYSWLHIDQSAPRMGLHCYQGAVYLEEASSADYCFRILSGSHRHLEEFYAAFPEAAESSVQREDFCLLEGAHVAWYHQRGCRLTKVPVPKGGIVLWDSRLVHDNCRPERGRPNPDRWRFVVFVCMAPARWSRSHDLERKRHAYHHLRMTTHWPAQHVSYFDEQLPVTAVTAPLLLPSLPEVAKSREARLMAGVEEYDFEDGDPNGPEWSPLWKD
ncbi:uncharacterized protein LOC143301971 [Babylonia areolata]|uniref:uncharacterized protein LOC143301971 n=1 Tax=Babylonia areolata TaxID=304850 RepID=UPI003FD133BE